MNDVQSPGDVEPPSRHNVVDLLTAGAMIRNAREAAGLHVAALAVSMKVPVKKLEALEADRLDLLPDVVFVRALAASVCRTLKIDPSAILSKLPQTNAPRLTAEGNSFNTPFNPPSDEKHYAAASSINRPVVWFVVVLLLAAVALLLVPDFQLKDQASVPAVAQTNEPPMQQMPSEIAETPKLEVLVDSVTPVISIAAAKAGEGQGPAQVTAPMVAAPTTPLTQPAVGALVSPTTPIVTPTVATTTGPLVFKAKGESWIEVTDANKAVQMRRIVSAGETVAVSGVLPLSVVIGRVDAIEVEVRGSKFSLLDIARDNVARFEVK